MRLCTLCRFETELDDVALAGPGSHCICLRCYQRATDSRRAMPKQLHGELTATLAALDAAYVDAAKF